MEQKGALRQEFVRRRRNHLLLILPGIAAIIGAAALSRAFGPVGTLQFVPAAAIAVLLVGLSWRQWRCPACRGYLGKALNPVVCRHCGFALRA